MSLKIGLCLITFNEEKVISRMLNSILPIVDYYVIVDTGSKDNTKKIIKKFFDEKNISGEIHDAEEFNMSKHLNFGFEKLKERKIDFALYIDSDNVLSIPKNFNVNDFKNELFKYDSGMINVTNKDIKYGKRLLYNLKKEWKWIGVIHENINWVEGTTTYNSQLNLIIHNDGNSWTSQTIKEKYLRHANIILKDIKENGETSRNIFYLAQSYRDAEEREKAIEYYQKRVLMKNGFFEEVYYSQLMIAGLKWALSKPVSEIADEYMKCGELDKLRAEHLYFLKLMYERNGRLNSAKQINDILKQYKNPYPERVLFINPVAYPNH